MKTYTIDGDHNITVFASKKEAAAASATPFDPFTSQSELAELAAAWPAKRLVEIWNSIPGVNAVTKFTNRRIATERIWKAIQNLGATVQPGLATDDEPPLPAPIPNVGPQVPNVASVATDTALKPTRAKKTPNRAAQPKNGGLREGSKAAQVVALLQRKNGATLAEIMGATSWQAHSVRGFISGILGKKMGLTVDSAKREDGERIYSIGK
jgi:hypothetical protein